MAANRTHPRPALAVVVVDTHAPFVDEATPAARILGNRPDGAGQGASAPERSEGENQGGPPKRAALKMKRYRPARSRSER